MANATRYLATVATGLSLASSLACGQGAESIPEHPRDPSTAIMRVEQRAGLAQPADRWTRPQFSLYGDGRAVVLDGHDGALLAAREYRLTDAAVRGLFRDAASANLFRDHTYERENVVDGSTLTISIQSTETRYITTVDTPGDDESGARGRVIDFWRHLDPARWPGQDLARPPATYQADRLAVLVLLLEGSTGTTDARPWPLESTLQSLRTWPEQPCVVLDGARMREAEALARGATPETRWVSEGRAFHVVFRPLLPDERDCADLDRAP